MIYFVGVLGIDETTYFWKAPYVFTTCDEHASMP